MTVISQDDWARVMPSQDDWDGMVVAQNAPPPLGQWPRPVLPSCSGPVALFGVVRGFGWAKITINSEDAYFYLSA